MHQILNIERLFSSRLLSINRTEVKTDLGTIREQLIIEPTSNAVAGVLVKKGKVVLVKTKRIQCSGTWELPGGWMEEGEGAISAIRRKILEETGFEIGDVQRIGRTFVDIGLSQKETFYFYLTAKEKIQEQNKETIEEIGLFTPEQIQKLIVEEKITDGKTLTGLMLVKNKGYM